MRPRLSRKPVAAPSEDETAARALLEYLNRADYRPMPQRELMHRTHVAAEDRPRVRKLIRRLVDDGRIRKVKGGRLSAVLPADGPRGILHRHREGYGFVVPESGGEDVFIAPQHQGRAASGDHVALRVTGRGSDGRLHGVISRVLERRDREVLGVFMERGRGGVVQPFDPQVGEAIRIRGAFRHDARHMHAVRVELMRQGDRSGLVDGKIVEALGHLDESGTDVAVVVNKYGLASQFPDDVLAAARALPKSVSRKMASGRERFDDPAPVTIDGETARDFDDAIAVRELPHGGFRLFVHIADVGHFVPVGGVLDVEARHRGTSVYFPDRVLPMFPEELSNGLCSLRPGEDRLVQSAIIDFAARGKVSRVRFADGVIRSAARLTYTGVAAALDEQSGHGIPERVVSMLHVANGLRRVLERRRHRRGSIDFDLPVPTILLDVEGVMTGITVEPRNEAHRMIEEFMLAANEAVAAHLERKAWPCMYRVHEPPDPLKLEALANFVEGFGMQLEEDQGEITPRSIQRLLEQVEGRPEYYVISQVALRSLKQARYSPDNTGHFGLASPAYCHFTSPIRRYPDLVVHGLLRAQRLGHDVDAEHDDERLLPLAVTASECERNAESAERELLVWKKVAFIADQTGESFEGIVTGVARFGLFVQLIDNHVEGLVRVELLGSEWFEFVENRLELRGERSGRVFRLGDRLSVRVSRVDRVLQRVDLALADAQEPPRKRPPPRGRRRARPPVRRRR